MLAAINAPQGAEPFKQSHRQQVLQPALVDALSPSSRVRTVASARPRFGEKPEKSMYLNGKAFYQAFKKQIRASVRGTAVLGGLIWAGKAYQDNPWGMAAWYIALILMHLIPLKSSYQGTYRKGKRHGTEDLLNQSMKPDGISNVIIQHLIAMTSQTHTQVTKKDSNTWVVSSSQPDEAKPLPNKDVFEKIETLINTLPKIDDDAQQSVAHIAITPNYDKQTVQISVQRPKGYQPAVEPERTRFLKNPRLAYKELWFRWFPDFSKYFWKTPVKP